MTSPILGLIADIGGTNARFALVDADGAWHGEKVVRCAAFPGPAEAARAYLAEVCPEARPRAGAFAIAGPVTGDRVALTNHLAWSFSTEETRVALELDRLSVVNDFIANALAVPRLAEEDRMWLTAASGPLARGRTPVAVMGPGTGLGVALLVPDPSGGRPVAIATEGGHVTLPASTEREAQIIAAARTRFGHVSAERFLSGPGLVTLAEVVRDLDGLPPEAIDAATIMERGLNGDDTLCAEVAALFYALLGTVAGNLVLTGGAWGGLALMGGILPRRPDALKASAFLERMRAKGRFGRLLDALPVCLVTHAYPAFLGLAGLVVEDQGAPR